MADFELMDVEVVRTFEATGMTLGVADDEDGVWWVYDQEHGRTSWHRHCGPYPTRQEAEDWIMAIRAEPQP